MTKVPSDAEPDHGPATGRKRDSRCASAVEEDHHERHRDDPLVGDHRQRAEGREERRTETDAATRNSAGLGTCSHAETRLEPTASEQRDGRHDDHQGERDHVVHRRLSGCPGVDESVDDADQTSRHSGSHLSASAAPAPERRQDVRQASGRPRPRLEPALGDRLAADLAGAVRAVGHPRRARRTSSSIASRCSCAETAASRSTAIEVPSPDPLAERDRADLAREAWSSSASSASERVPRARRAARSASSCIRPG